MVINLLRKNLTKENPTKENRTSAADTKNAKVDMATNHSRKNLTKENLTKENRTSVADIKNAKAAMATNHSRKSLTNAKPTIADLIKKEQEAVTATSLILLKENPTRKSHLNAERTTKADTKNRTTKGLLKEIIATKVLIKADTKSALKADLTISHFTKKMATHLIKNHQDGTMV